MNINDDKEFLLQPHLVLLILLAHHRQILLQPQLILLILLGRHRQFLLQPLLQVVIITAVTHLVLLILLRQEQLQLHDLNMNYNMIPYESYN